MLLEQGGFEVDVVDSGRPVIGLIACRHPDAVVLDLSLPDIDGVVVAGAVRNAWPTMPIILATGHDPNGPLLETLSRLGVSVLRKPYEITALIARLEQMIPS